MSLSSKSALVGLIGALFAALVLLTTEGYLYSRNTPIENGRWESTKIFLEMTPMGSHHFLMTRNGLQGNKLRLGAWHAENEINYGRAVDPGEISFTFELAEGAYVCVLFNRTVSGYDGIRLSRSARYPSQFFRVDRSGRFLVREPLATQSIGAGSQSLRLSFLEEHVEATMNGEPLQLPPTGVVRPQWFGFRGGAEPAAVDNVRVVDREGDIVLFETFRNTRAYTRVAAVAAGAWALILGLVVLLSRGKLEVAAPRIVGVLFVCLTCGSALALFDFYVWSKRYPYAEFTPDLKRGSQISSAIEDFRHKLFGNPPKGWVLTHELRGRSIAPLLTERNWHSAPHAYGGIAYYGARHDGPILFSRDQLDQYAENVDGSVRVFFMGGSQTYGEGADALEHTIVSRVYERLESEDLGVPIEVFNFSYPAAESGPLFDSYRDTWAALRPDLVVLNVSFNDPSADVLCANIRRFVKLTRDRGAKFILVIEPTPTPRNEKHRRMKALGPKLGITVLDLNEYMNSEGMYDIGFLWWDFIHATSLGQLEIAEWLTPSLVPVIRDSLDR